MICEDNSYTIQVVSNALQKQSINHLVTLIMI